MHAGQETREEQEVRPESVSHELTFENERIYRALFQDSHSVMLLIDPETGRIVDANPAACSFYGYTQADLTLKNISQINTLPMERLFEAMGQAKKEEENHFLFDHRLSTGEARAVEVYSGPVRARGKTLLYSIIHDIANRKHSEEVEQARMGKLESLGACAGGIAHDFNNILTMILGNVSLARMYMNKDRGKAFEKLTKAEESITRAKDLNRQLLTFSKGGLPNKRVVHIEDLLKEVCQFALRGTSIACAFDCAPDLALVEIDEGQITQAIDHVLINGYQAMPQGGVISVAGQNITMENATEHIPAGRFVRISITDQGIGIPESYLSKIFDPCFTTKQRGSGLGLAICYSVVKSHGGHIAVDSTLGVGTSFSIYLPAFEGGQSMERDTEGEMAVPGGRILVMDDEDSIRDIVGDMLDYHGYKADFAKNGDEALSLYRENAYDVVILDLTVPGGLGGKETVRELLRIDPKVKAIVSSGYSSDPIMSNYEQYGFKDVIAKPYRIEDLGEVVRKVIAGE